MRGDVMYYNKEINIYEYNSYEDEHGIDREGYSKINDKPIMVDMQPYSSEKAKKDYGYNIECSRRMFCDIIPEITEDCIIEFSNKFYSVEKIPWDDEYYEILLNETKGINILVVEENE
ncbi:hypothetical protein [Clostridium butyricum]